ncbi:MAG: hypothetical protein IJ705_01125 [Oscillospiraceae bacterium]|nr:hypothetical protein [Oscillospiraceae bacterium]
MPTELDRHDARQSMAYDLIMILEQNPGKTYTVEEIKAIIQAVLKK